MSPGPVEACLRAGRERIVKYGWIQGLWGSSWDGFCAEGAVGCGSMFACNATVPAVELLLAASEIKTSLPKWNDTPGRTVAEVLAAYDRAISLAAQEGR